MRLRSLRADLKESKGRIEFPDEIDGDIEVDGLPDKHFRAKRLKHVRLPVIEKDGITKKQKKKMVAKVTYYCLYLHYYLQTRIRGGGGGGRGPDPPPS